MNQEIKPLRGEKLVTRREVLQMERQLTNAALQQAQEGLGEGWYLMRCDQIPRELEQHFMWTGQAFGFEPYYIRQAGGSDSHIIYTLTGLSAN